MKPHEKHLNKLSSNMIKLLEASKSAGEDICHNASALAKAQLGKLDLISKEEFDIQQATVEKLQARIEQLEQQVDTLINQQNSSPQ